MKMFLAAILGAGVLADAVLAQTNTAPVITQQPQSQTVYEGSSVSFATAATSPTPIQYQWTFASVPIPGATNPLYTIATANTNLAGTYTVVLSNATGSVTSDAATLTVLLLTNTAPVITQQPATQSVEEGSIARLIVGADGAPPLGYQWLRNGTNLPGATDFGLVISPVSTNDAGGYYVVITNALGSVTSAQAVLTVIPITARRLRVNGYETPSQVAIPVELAALGGESAASFTLAFDPAVLANPLTENRIDLTDTNVVGGVATNAANDVTYVFNTNELAQGHLGVSLNLPGGMYLREGTNRLLNVRFDLQPGRTPRQAGLGLIEQPVPTVVRDTNGLSLPVRNEVLPKLVPATNPPALDLQSGLFLHTVTVINAGNSNLPNARVAIHGLGVDSQTNLITVQNANSVTLVQDLKGTNYLVPFVEYGPITNGDSVDLTIEYYVSDRTTLPQPVYEAQVANPVFPFVSEGTAFKIERSIYTNSTFLIEFTSITNVIYHVEYATDPGGTNWQLVVSGIIGNGERMQWIDNGPPKTQTRPDGVRARFYRMLH